MTDPAVSACLPCSFGLLPHPRSDRRSGPLPLTVCFARGWDREVERHQVTRQRLLQLLGQLGESETG